MKLISNLAVYYIFKRIILILILKSMRGIIVHRRPQLIKLSTLLDFYQAEPQSQYRLCVQNGYLKTDISPNTNAYSSSNCRQQQQQFANTKAIDRVQKKTVGLFSNLIKKMDTNRQTAYEYQTEQQQCSKRKQYQFYFREFQNQSEQSGVKQMESTSIKKIKERATGLINVNLRRQNESKENKKNDINQKNNPNQNINKEPSIDINFSFEEISNHVNERRHATKLNQQNQPYEIKITAAGPPLKKQSSLTDQAKQPIQNNILPPLINEHEQSLKQVSIPSNLLPSIGFSLQDKQQIFSPIPHKSRHQIRINNQSNINPNHLNNQNRAGVSVQGAKKAQSRVYNNSQDSKDIKIDFDFQIDI